MAVAQHLLPNNKIISGESCRAAPWEPRLRRDLGRRHIDHRHSDRRHIGHRLRDRYRRDRSTGATASPPETSRRPEDDSPRRPGRTAPTTNPDPYAPTLRSDLAMPATATAAATATTSAVLPFLTANATHHHHGTIATTRRRETTLRHWRHTIPIVVDHSQSEEIDTKRGPSLLSLD